MTLSNPFLNLPFEPAFESLGGDYSDRVVAADFPIHTLRFRNDDVLRILGLDPAQVSDEDFVEAFGQFKERSPLLAMRYHGYQFGEYNSQLGDGRGFLYGQVRGTDGELYDFGTKGSGTTPYSRGGDGRLTLKGGVREVLATEMLHRLGVRTSRSFSLIETGEALWRGDEPSPTRSSVLVRFSRSHIRFGTFERLHYLNRPDLIKPLLDHVIAIYYPHLVGKDDAYAQFYAELVRRVAELVAQWMSIGFCHAVLNTDNMSITGESFDYGPFAFIQDYNPRFAAAYFDYSGRYSYGNQPLICRFNLEMLQIPLKAVIDPAEMEVGLAQFDEHYQQHYQQRMMKRLGFTDLPEEIAADLLRDTIRVLQETTIDYHEFFLSLRQQFYPAWRSDVANVFGTVESAQSGEKIESFETWRQTYHRALNQLPESATTDVAQCLSEHNPNFVIVRPEIEAIWEPITTEDNWQPFYNALTKIRKAVD